MTTSTIVKVNSKGTITFPKEVQEYWKKYWKGADVYVNVMDDTVILKKMYNPSFSELEPKLKKLGRLIKQKDIDETVREVRKELYESRS